MIHTHQFALPFASADRYAPDEFFRSASNEAALTWLAAPGAWPSLRLAVYGDPGSGKTHLLHYFAQRHAATVLQAGDVQGHARPGTDPAVAIDDADTVPDAEALLHVLNAAAERGAPVLLTGRTAPSRWPYILPDLVSRLRATPIVALLPPDDYLLRTMLARLIAERQVAVPERVQEYLLARLPRTGKALREATALLDRYSLASGRAVSVKLAERVAEECAALADQQ